jgi:hypothetical protein
MRLALTAAESVKSIGNMETLFNGGANWIQGAYHTADGHCVVGAAQHVRRTSGDGLDDARYWLRQAIAEKTGGNGHIESFNDSRESYSEIAEVMTRAKELALAHRQGQQAPPARPALAYQPEDDHTVTLTLDDLERVAKRRG